MSDDIAERILWIDGRYFCGGVVADASGRIIAWPPILRRRVVKDAVNTVAALRRLGASKGWAIREVGA